MNSNLHRIIVAIAYACLLLVPIRGFSQLILISADPTNVSGMCYLTVTYSQGSQSCCTAVFSTPVTRDGQTLSTKLEYGYITGCLSIPECKEPVLSTTLVLGSLEAGTYFLNMTNLGFLPALRTISFPVPARADNTPMLSLTATNGNDFSLNVAGVPAVQYVVQASTDFTNWTTLRTNIGAPFSMNISATSDATFYRTLLYSSHEFFE